MNVELALLTAIHATPGDETQWLVLADWLEDKGEADRAALLRLQRRLRGYDEGLEREELERQALAMLRTGVRPCVPIVVSSIGMQLALIPAGRFWLGSPDDEEGRYGDESPRVPMEIRRPFYLGVYPVTQAEYQCVTGHNPSAFRPGGRLEEAVQGMNTSRHPVEEVSWDDAEAFCRRLSALPAELEQGRQYRLPTETEWEYACRGGMALCCAFPFGRSISTEMANYRASSRRRKSPAHTTPVDTYLPNGFGLYDMVGNVWEWCADWYSSDAYSRNPFHDPPGPRDGERRNARGGNYNLETRRVRSADRSSFVPEQKDSDLGFRVLCTWTDGS